MTGDAGPIMVTPRLSFQAFSSRAVVGNVHRRTLGTSKQLRRKWSEKISAVSKRVLRLRFRQTKKLNCVKRMEKNVKYKKTVALDKLLNISNSDYEKRGT